MGLSVHDTTSLPSSQCPPVPVHLLYSSTCPFLSPSALIPLSPSLLSFSCLFSTPLPMFCPPLHFWPSLSAVSADRGPGDQLAAGFYLPDEPGHRALVQTEVWDVEQMFGDRRHSASIARLILSPLTLTLSYAGGWSSLYASGQPGEIALLLEGPET